MHFALNVNTRVRVRLTDAGLQQLQVRYRGVLTPEQVVEKVGPDRLWEDTLWELFNVFSFPFGLTTLNGLPFINNEIVFIDELGEPSGTLNGEELWKLLDNCETPFFQSSSTANTRLLELIGAAAARGRWLELELAKLRKSDVSGSEVIRREFKLLAAKFGHGGHETHCLDYSTYLGAKIDRMKQDNAGLQARIATLENLFPRFGNGEVVLPGSQHWVVLGGKPMCRCPDVRWSELDDPSKDWSQVYPSEAAVLEALRAAGEKGEGG